MTQRVALRWTVSILLTVWYRYMGSIRGNNLAGAPLKFDMLYICTRILDLSHIRYFQEGGAKKPIRCLFIKFHLVIKHSGADCILTTSLRRQLVKYMWTISSNTLLSLIENLRICKRFSHFFQQK